MNHCEWIWLAVLLLVCVCVACMWSVILLKCVGRKFCCKCLKVTVSGTTGIHVMGDLQASNLLKNVTYLLKRKYMK
jgi:hypothetical protein